MPAYAIARLQASAPHPDIDEYLERLSGTLKPYGGHYLVHGKPHEVKEGRGLRPGFTRQRHAGRQSARQ